MYLAKSASTEWVASQVQKAESAKSGLFLEKSPIC